MNDTRFRIRPTAPFTTFVCLEVPRLPHYFLCPSFWVSIVRQTHTVVRSLIPLHRGGTLTNSFREMDTPPVRLSQSLSELPVRLLKLEVVLRLPKGCPLIVPLGTRSHPSKTGFSCPHSHLRLWFLPLLLVALFLPSLARILSSSHLPLFTTKFGLNPPLLMSKVHGSPLARDPPTRKTKYTQ